MNVPVGFIAKLWSFISFLPFFLLLLILGVVKAIIFGPIAVVIIAVGNSAVIIGLWPAHFIWTYYCVAKTKRLGIVLKILVLCLSLLPLLLWPIVGIAASVVGGVGYGFFTPLLATFEAVGENVADKHYHCFVDGCWSVLEGSCTAVRDFNDICFHSYFSFMDELSENMPEDEKPIDIKLSMVPGSLLVSLFALPVDVPAITAVALWKSPYMLYRGWQRLLHDLVGREGPFLETVCVPFAGLAIMLWPLAVVASVIASFLSSFFLGLYAGVVVHQEDSVGLGFAYIVAVISHFDEYTNDLLFLREGSCLPRPRYRRNVSSSLDNDVGTEKTSDIEQSGESSAKEGSNNSELLSQRSGTLKAKLHHYKPIQVLDWLFKSCEAEGQVLLRDGLIDVKDIEDCFVKGDSKKLGVVLPAWCILKCLLASVKSSSPGLVISNEVELMKTNWPRDKVSQWFVGPLLIMKEQIKGLDLREDEEACLRRLVMRYKNERPADWDESGFPSGDNVKRAQLQAIIRRLQGIVGSMSRMPTFRRRFQDLVKVLYMELVKTGALAHYVVGSPDSAAERKISVNGSGNSSGMESQRDEVGHSELNVEGMV